MTARISPLPLILLLGLLLGPGNPVRAQAPEQDLRNTALSVLLASLSTPGSVFSQDLLGHISSASGLSVDSVQTAITVMLDSLNEQRHRKTTPWLALIGAGGQDVSTRKMDRLVRAWIDWGQKAAGGDNNFGLNQIIERSAARAKIPTHRARELLAAAAGMGLTGSAATGDTLPSTFGLLVVGRSAYRVDGSRFAGLLLSEDDINRQTRFRDLHGRLTAKLIETLPELKGLRWAIDAPHPRLEPDAILQVDISDLFTQRVRRNIILHGTVRIALSTASGLRLFATDLDMAYDFWLEPDDQIRNQRRLDGFLRKFSDAICAEVERYLTTRAPG